MVANCWKIHDEKSVSTDWLVAVGHEANDDNDGGGVGELGNIPMLVQTARSWCELFRRVPLGENTASSRRS